MIGKPIEAEGERRRPGKIRLAKRSASVPFVLVCAALLIIKFPLVNVGGSALRFEDVLLAGALFTASTGGVFALYRADPIDRAVFVVVAINVFAAILGLIRHKVGLVSSSLYAVRPLEYWLAKPIVQIAFAQGIRIRRVLTVYAALLALLCIAQLAGLHVGASSFDTARASGNTNGPYELAAVAAGLLTFGLLYASPRILVPATIAMVSSASRSTLVGLLVALGAVSGRARRLALIAAAVFFVAQAGLTYSGLLGQTTTQRLATSSPLATWHAAGKFTIADPQIRSQAEYKLYAYDRLLEIPPGQGSDASGFIRYVRWRVALNAVSTDKLAWVVGLGPSFAFAALDGNYVRMIVETGVLGLLTYAVLFRRIWRYCDNLVRPYLLALLITGVFIDIFVALKPILLLWILVGASVSAKGLDCKQDEVAG